MKREVAQHHWNYYLNIEDDLYKLSSAIEFCDDNLKVYSIELAKILLSACSEIDVVCRMISSSIDKTKTFDDDSDRSGNIVEYYEVISSKYPKLVESEISLMRMGKIIKPLNNWSRSSTPTWWGDYNKVKHYRHSNYKKANLENCIDATAALLVLNLYLLVESTGDSGATYSGNTKLFDCEYYSKSLYCLADARLPDFVK